MHIVMVRFRVKPDKVADFLRESIGDASGSVLTEPGCRRFDVIQANDDPTMVAFTEVYDNVAAFDDHKTRPHFSTWAKNTKDMLDGPAYVAECRPLFPQGRHAQNALGGGHVDPWSSYRPDAADHPHFRNAGLMVLWVPLPVKPERVNDFIQSALGDCVGSTREEPGCLRFDMYQDIKNPSELFFYEVYANPAAFDYHAKTPHIQKWRDTVKDWYARERTGVVRGKNIWPADNWNWSSGKPRF
ncbi:MAG: antibiotic biosynthesis monooxygenase [SAR202 cluster bacterium]|nr:antibiotic biosynthesis monooxygenase [SAR202 cluster bacterium]